VGWLGGNVEPPIPIVKYIVKISHKGLRLGAYSGYQMKLSDLILDLRDRGRLMYKEIAEKLTLEGYRSPRGLDLGPESVFSIYKKRRIRDLRLSAEPSVELRKIEIVTS